MIEKVSSQKFWKVLYFFPSFIIIQGPPCIFAPYIFCPADCFLNFPALFWLAAFITSPCGCFKWKSHQNLSYFQNDHKFRVRSKNNYASPTWPWSKTREAMLNNCLLLLFFVKSYRLWLYWLYTPLNFFVIAS